MTGHLPAPAGADASRAVTNAVWLDARVDPDGRTALIARLEQAGSVAEAEEALGAAREWIEEHPDDAEVIGTAGRLAALSQALREIGLDELPPSTGAR